MALSLYWVGHMRSKDGYCDVVFVAKSTNFNNLLHGAIFHITLVQTLIMLQTIIHSAC